MLAGLLSTSLYWQYRQHQALIFSEATEKAEIIAIEATRTREYLSAQLLEGDIELSSERYGIIPVVAANRIGQTVAEDLTYTIKHTSNRYRNPANAPDDYEAKVLEKLAVNPDLDHFAELTTIADTRVFRYLRAAYADSSCLECHGDPAESPRFLKEIYPLADDPAYRYVTGDMIGAISIAIPIAEIEKRLAAGFKNTLITTGVFFCLLVLIIGYLIERTVLKPVNSLAAAISNLRQTGEFTEAPELTGNDEISGLVGSYNEMIRELEQKTSHLEESERRFRLMTQVSQDAIVAFLPNGKIFLFNENAEQLFGYQQNEMLGETLTKIFTEAPVSEDKSLEDAIRENDLSWFHEKQTLTGVRKDQSEVMLEMSVKMAGTADQPFYMAFFKRKS